MRSRFCPSARSRNVGLLLGLMLARRVNSGTHLFIKVSDLLRGRQCVKGRPVVVGKLAPRILWRAVIPEAMAPGRVGIVPTHPVHWRRSGPWRGTRRRREPNGRTCGDRATNWPAVPEGTRPPAFACHHNIAARSDHSRPTYRIARPGDSARTTGGSTRPDRDAPDADSGTDRNQHGRGVAAVGRYRCRRIHRSRARRRVCADQHKRCENGRR